MNTFQHEDVIRQFADGAGLARVDLDAANPLELGVRIMLRTYKESGAVMYTSDGYITVPVAVHDISRNDNIMIIWFKKV